MKLSSPKSRVHMSQPAAASAALNTLLRTSLLASAIACALSARAAPQGGVVTAGDATISQSLTNTSILQHSGHVVIDWNSFNVAGNESVQFIQPSATSAALNQIYDQSPSQIFGSLNANGLVFLINPNGFLFGATAQVNVGGLLATSLLIDTGAFMNGIYQLHSDGLHDGMIINRGLLNAASGGVALVSDTGVINEGRILATYGNVNIAATLAATLDFDGDGLLRLQVDGAVLDNAQSLQSAIDNSGEIIVTGGDVLISGQVARDVFSNVVNNSGVIRASRIVDEGGVVRLMAEGSSITSSGVIDVSSTSTHGGQIVLQSDADTLITGDGVLDASSTRAHGGEIQLLGNRVGLFDNAQLDASGALGGGEILIGGDFQGSNAQIKNAAQTYVGANASIKANATDNGDGGKIIVWADNTTQYYGSIEAIGGVNGGDGGFAEVSGKNALDFSGAVNLATTLGAGGTLLLDPGNINVVDGGTDTADLPDIAFTDSAGLDLSIDASDINTPLRAGTNVILRATDDITINEAIDGDDGSEDGALTLIAGDDIIINQSIIVDGALSITAGAGGTPPVSADGTADIGINADINASNHNISLTTASANNGGDIGGTGTVVVDSGNTITIDSNLGVSAFNTNLTNTGTINITTHGDNSSGDVLLVSNSTLNTNRISGITTTGAGTQTIDLYATVATIGTGDIVLSNALNVGTDTLHLTAEDSVSGASALTAGSLIIDVANADSGMAVDLTNTNVSTLSIAAAATGTININNTGVLDINGITSTDSAITITNAGAVSVSSDVNADTATIAVTTTAAGNIDSNGGALVTTGDVMLNAAGGIGIFSALQTTAGTLDLSTAGAAAAGNITLVDSGDFATADVTVATASNDLQIMDLSANSWSITENRDFGNNTLIVRATGGNISDGSAGAGGSTITTSGSGGAGFQATGSIDVSSNAATLAASAGGTLRIDSSYTTGALAVGSVGDLDGFTSTDSAIVLTSADAAININQAIDAGTATVSLTTTDPGDDASHAISGSALISAAAGITVVADGGIDIVTNTAGAALNLTAAGNAAAGNITVVDSSNLTTADLTISTTGTGTQTIDLSANNWDIDTNFSTGADTLVLRASGGDIIDTAGNHLLTAASIGLTATDSIDVNTVAATIAASAGTGTLQIDSTFDAGDNTGTLVVASVGGISGLTSSNQSITLSSDDADISITQAIAAGTGAVNLTTTQTDFVGDYNISGAGVISATGGVSVSADGAINIVTSIGAGTASLTSSGNAAAGNITFSDDANRATSDVALVTTGTGSQVIDLSADSWDIDSNVGVGNDTLILRATAGAISDGGDNNLLNAAAIGLNASNGINVNTVAATIAANAGTGSLRIASTYDTGDNTGTLNVGSVGGITGLTTSNQSITLTSDDTDVNLAQNINAGNGVVAITTTETDFAGDYTISGTGTVSSGGITVVADGLININTATGGNAISLTTNGNDAQGNITLLETDAISTSSLAITTTGTNVSGLRTLALTAAAWTIDGTFDVGSNHLNLIASAVSTAGDHGIFSAGGIDAIVTTGVISLASATGIGISGSPLRVSADSLLLATTGTGADGDIHVDGSGSALNLGAVSTAATSQTISLTADSWLLSSDVDFATDNIAIFAVAGDISDAGLYTLTANSIGLGASGNINMTTNAPEIAASAGGSVVINSVYNAGDVSIDSVDTISGISAGNTITLSSNDASLVLDQAVTTATGDISISTTDSGVTGNYDVTGSALITAPGTLTVVADGGIGTTAAINTNVGASSLTTNGAAAAGNIAVILAGAQATSSLPFINMSGAGTQTLDLQAQSWNVDGDINLIDIFMPANSDNLILRASTGNISNGGGSLSANDLSLMATASNASIGSNGVTISPINVNAVGTLSADASNGNGGIYLNDLGATAISASGIDAGTGNVELLSAGAVSSAGTIIGNDLLVVANGGVNTASQVSNLAITTNATGDIVISNAGTLNIIDLTQSDTTIHNGVTAFDGDINITADDTITVSADITERNQNLNAASNIALTTTANNGNIIGNGGTLVTAAAAIVAADGGIGGVNSLLINSATVDLTTAGDVAAGNVHVTFVGGQSASNITNLTTAGAGKQLVELHADSWIIDSAIGNSADDLILDAIAVNGSVIGDGGFQVVADALGIKATSSIVDLFTSGNRLQISVNSLSVRATNDVALFENISGSTLTITDMTDSTGGVISGVSDDFDVVIVSNGDIVIDSDITSVLNLVAITANGGDIVGGAGTITANAPGFFATGLQLTASGGIGAGSPVNTAGTANLAIVTSGNNSAGDINIHHTGNLAIGASSGNSFVTSGSGTQTLNLSADAWSIAGAFDGGDNTINLSSTVGGITNSTGLSSDSLTTTGDISLITATGIGMMGSAINVAANTLSLNTAGMNAIGDIYIVSGVAIGLGAGISTDAGSAQNIELQAGAWSLGSDVDFGADNLILRATAGDIVDNGNTLIANSVGLAATGDIDATTDAATIAADAGGTIIIDSVRNTGTVSVGTVGTVNGIVSGDAGVAAGSNAITLTSTDASLVIAQGISNSSGEITITTSDSGTTGDYNVSGSATVSSVGDVTISADGGIGVSGVNPLNVSAAGNLAVATSGVGAAGDIYIASASALSLGSGLSTDIASVQTVDLLASNWALTSNVSFGTDILVLRATSGNISDGTAGLDGFTIVAASTGFSASGNVDVTVLADIVAVNSGGSVVIDSNRSAGTLSVGSVSGINGITSANAAITLDTANNLSIDQNIASGNGSISLVSTGNIGGAAGITGGALSLTSTGGSVLNGTNGVTQLTTTNTNSGNIEFTNTSPTFTLAGVSQSGGGDVIISNNGNIINDGNVSVINGGDFSLTATGANHAITVNNAIAAANVNLAATSTITQQGSGVINASLLTTTSAGGLSLALSNNLDSFNAGETLGNITLLDNGALNVTGITTLGNISITTTGALTASGAISASALATSTSGGATLDNPANNVDSFTAVNSDSGDVMLVDTGSLNLLEVTTVGDIVINTTGDVLQTQTIASSTGGDITVASSGGSLSMQAGTRATTTGGTINYTANGGNITLALLDAANGVAANVGTVHVTTSATALNTSTVNPGVRANTVTFDALQIGTTGTPFLFSSDIQGTITLQYVGSAFVAAAPNFNVSLDFVDLGSGLIDSTAARSAGNQRGQSTGLEDVGFIDAALFSDINLFVVDGMGVALPNDQNDVLPGDVPATDPDDEKQRKKLNKINKQNLEASNVL